MCDYSDVYALVTGNITAAGGNAPSRRCVTQINEENVETAENLNIIMPMCNLLEYKNNYTDSFGSLWHFKRDEQS